MAKRPVLRKRANRLRKALRSELPAFIDLVDYLKMRGHADTTGQAEKIILAGRVRADSHKLGIGQAKQPKRSARLAVLLGRPLEESDFEMVPVVERLVPATVRDRIMVLPS